jgi:hypothetical protein
MIKIQDINALDGVKLASTVSKTTYFMLESNINLVGEDYESSLQNLLNLEEKAFKNLFCIAFYYQFLGENKYEINALDSIINEKSLQNTYRAYYNLHKQFYSLEFFRFANTSKTSSFEIDLEILPEHVSLKFIDYLDIILKKNGLNGY